jgi:DNA polymerase-1
VVEVRRWQIPDNVPGVPGIGVKTAAELIKTYGDVETLLKRAGEIKQPKRRESLQQNAELARVSRELVKLKDDVAVEAPLGEFARREPDRDTLMAFLKANQFRAVIARVESGAFKVRPAQRQRRRGRHWPAHRQRADPAPDGDRSAMSL